MRRKTPQELAAECKKDSAMMRAGFVKAMQIFEGMENLPDNLKKIATECIEIVGGLREYKKKSQEIEDPQGTEESKENSEEPKRINPQSPNYRFRKRR